VSFKFKNYGRIKEFIIELSLRINLMSYTLKAFNQIKVINKASKDLLTRSEKASNVSWCIINKRKYIVSTSLLNQILKN